MFELELNLNSSMAIKTHLNKNTEQLIVQGHEKTPRDMAMSFSFHAL
jgi:hypothetical protein